MKFLTFKLFTIKQVNQNINYTKLLQYKKQNYKIKLCKNIRHRDTLNAQHMKKKNLKYVFLEQI